ncbi:unnamed protein product [Parnassius apollo]|uniref:(apollo) hypothetical protein n=1 Tax=Parnassius apollo TaxID=110799 RepID=A0A8S3WGK0_PARAO|nr:unnamed protein product [Parnassius apollo]
MIRLWSFLVLCLVVRADIYEDIDKLFLNSGDETAPECSGVQGDLPRGCYECYLCNDSRLRNYHTPNHKIIHLTDHSCTTTDLCCVPQEDLIPRNGGQCGVMVPGGFKVVKGKKQKKTNARSVLKGEYPWRAWIYRRDDYRPLCAGTIVEDNVDFVLTSATCVHNYIGTDLIVSFSRDRNEEIDVEAIKVHESYRSKTPSINDIALLKLNKTRERTPRWVKPVCYHNLPPMHATTCTIIADSDHFINPVVPLPEKCKIGNKDLHVSQICAIAPPGDYDPETGAGLFCPDSLRTGDSNFYINGIALEQHESITIYTKVSHFAGWIDQEISQGFND